MCSACSANGKNELTNEWWLLASGSGANYHVSSFEYPVEVEVLVGLDEGLGLGAGLPFVVAVDGRPGSAQEAVEAVPPDS